MAYIGLIIAVFICAFLKIPQKKYQNENIGIESSDNIYLWLCAFMSLIFYAIFAKGNIVPNTRTIIYASFYAVLSIMSVMGNFVALKNVDLVNIVVATNAGSIIFPFVFGLFYLNEPFSVFKILAVLILVFVVFMPFFDKKEKKKTNIKGHIACMVLFFSFGSSVILNKLYVMDTLVKSNDVFCFWTNVLMIPVTLIISLKTQRIKDIFCDIKKIKAKSYIIAIAGIALTSIYTLMNIGILKYIDVTVYSVLNASLMLIFTSLLARIFYKEKITGVIILKIVLSIGAILLNTI